jgi:branched-chain amino acid transport system permease protein
MSQALASVHAELGPLLSVTLERFTDLGVWTGIGILAGTYTLFALGLQLNVGFTGIVNFGQAGFMAIGAYAMAILVV